MYALFALAVFSVALSAQAMPWQFPREATLRSSSAPADLKTCAKILNDDPNAAATGAETYLKSVREAPALKVSLPYYFTKGYEARFTRLDLRLPEVRGVYLAYAEDVQVIPTKAYVESTHYLIRRLDGYHFTLTFSSLEERQRFLTRIGHRAHLVEGKLHSHQGEEPIVVLTPEQFTLAQADNSLQERDFVRVTKSELNAVSDYSEKTLRPGGSGTTYYFKGQRIVGFHRDGKYFKYVGRASPSTLENNATHAEILRRQTGAYLSKALGVVREVPLKPSEQFALGRANIAEALAGLRKDARLSEVLARNLVLVRSPGRQWAGALPSIFSGMARERLGALESLIMARSALAAEAGGEITTILRPSRFSVASGATRARLVRFLWVRGGATGGAPFILSDGELLHDQMAALAFDSTLVDTREFTERYLRGGVAEIQYGADGRPRYAEILSGTITLPTGIFEISEEEASRVGSQLLKYLSSI